MLLTRSRLCPGASPGSSLHLHVLSTPPAFVLSQDQTLREVNFMKSARRDPAEPAYTRAAASHQRGLNALSLPSDEGGRSGRIWTHIPTPRLGVVCACC